MAQQDLRTGTVDFFKHIYDLFNARDMEAVLAALHEDVMWANGWEGGHVHGREGVRDYWTRQWAVLDPRVEPVAFSSRSTGETVRFIKLCTIAMGSCWRIKR